MAQFGVCWHFSQGACASARSTPHVCLAHGAAGRMARWWRAPAALFALLTAPEGRGYAPLPPVSPTRGKLSLQAFARFARVLRSAQVFLCSRT